MKILPRFLFSCSAIVLVSAGAHAAGTYYTGNYQSPQRSYSQQSYTQRARTTNYSSQGVSAYNRNQYANAGYTTNSRAGMTQQPQQPQQSQQKRVATQSSAHGFSLDAGLSKQVAMWEFEMDTAGSKLHYDNIDWLVFDAAAKSVFDVGNTAVQIGAGLQYGMQTGETSMIDDDISHGGYLYGLYYGVNSAGNAFTGEKLGHALSSGVSKDGDMFGYNVGIGLTDFFKLGNLRITPSVGWRYLKYDLKTTNNKGVVFVNADYDASCVTLMDGSTQCWPLIAVFDGIQNYANPAYPGYSYFDANGNQLVDSDGDGYLEGDAVYAAVQVPGGYDLVEAEGTFYFEQPDVSHSYEVEWSGPYVALDMQYDINQNNVVVANVELGLPSYTATGDQPYRIDWQHPKSVQDKGGIGSGIHFGMGANWRTAITDKVALSIGLTYDYYSVSDADATTYLNPSYWVPEYENAFNLWKKVLNTDFGNTFSDSQIEHFMQNGISQADRILDTNGQVVELDPEYVAVVRANNWEDKVDSEIKSFYKSLGIRIGVNARF
ncbi:MAG: hypothetical protein E7007_02950 [Alphaproteobacteria bacterium]|nr:hypothetical protein [Alphaproteobacteria bacterium]